MMKSKFLLYLLLFLNSISFFSVYSQPVKAFPFQNLNSNWLSLKKNPQTDKSGQKYIALPEEGIQPNILYPTGHFQTILIVPQDTSSETSCPNLEDRSFPTIQIEDNTSQNIVLRDETKQIENAGRNTVLGHKTKNFKIISLQNDLLPGKTYSLTITDTVDLSSRRIIPFSVISKDKVNQLCSSLKEISGQINDEGTKKIKKALLYGEYNLYSYAIPELEKLLSEGKTPPKYNVIVYTALALYYEEIGFLRKALEKYNKALEEAKKCSEKMPCDFKITGDQNINSSQVQAFINQRLGYIYLYNPKLNDPNLANTKPIPEEQRLEKIISYLREAKRLLKCAPSNEDPNLNDDPNCKILNEKLRLLN